MLVYLIFICILILSNFSFGYDHINYYSNGNFSYIESFLNVVGQIGIYSVFFILYFTYCIFYSFDLTIFLSVVLYTLLPTIAQLIVAAVLTTFTLTYLYFHWERESSIEEEFIENKQIEQTQIYEKEKYEGDDISDELVKALKDFQIEGRIVNIFHGAIITLYEFEPKRGTKSSRVIALSDDVSLTLNLSIRIALIVGKNTIGIEVENKNRRPVIFNKILRSEKFVRSTHRLPIILGEDISGDPFIEDLAAMPHLLIAGTTGSGKSVGINSIILSLIYRSNKKCQLILIDPKRLEFSQYENISELAKPIAYTSEEAIKVLEWAVEEMKIRYSKMAKSGVRSIEQYKGKMPYIVIIIDELADLMLCAPKQIEILIQRLSQMSRAAGIHIIIATQRPSVNVITGTIKSNFPSRISFKLASKIDSRTIIGEQGAEQLTGKGDMLYQQLSGTIIRLHAPLVTEKEIQKIIRGK